MTARTGLTIDALGQSWRLVLDMNALADLGQITGRNGLLVMAEAEGDPANGIPPDAGLMRALMWAMLQEHHPGTDLRTAGKILTEAPEAFAKALRAALPAAPSPEASPPGEATAGTPPPP